MAKIKQLVSLENEDNTVFETQRSNLPHENLFLDNDDEVCGRESEDSGAPLPKSYPNKRSLPRDETNEVCKKKMKRKNDLFKQPTVEELNQLRETENLFHSNLFRLQIEEVLSIVKLKEKYKKQFEAWFLRFKKNIQSIEETEGFPLGSTEVLNDLGIKVPQPAIPTDRNGTFKFLKPSNISVIGSYSLESMVNPDKIVIDVMIEMPSKLFQKQDYRNYRYTRKRNIYLTYVAASLDEELVESKKFVGEIWSPKLKIIPSGTLGKRVTVNVYLAAEETSFKLNRFLPEKNSVRPDWYFGSEKSSDGSESLTPTPHYNFMILHDLTMSQINSRNAKILQEYPNLRDGIIMLKIWLRQRQFNCAYDSFNGHILTMYVLYLLYEKKLNTFMSSYQIIRNVWNCLALSDWNKNGLTMCPEVESKTRVTEYHKYYDCVFLDTSGYHNLAAHVSADTYHWIRSEAELSVKCLDNPNPSTDSFQLLFMRQVPFYLTFDQFVCLNDTSALEKIVEDKSSRNDKLDYGPNKRTQIIKLICGVLRKGLGNRVSNMYVRLEKQKEWELTDEAPAGIDRIIIGLSMDPQFCFNIIDKGPSANLHEAAGFRQFWGNKSELRRFQDGTICEAIVWAKGNTLAEKRKICKNIVRYLLKEKFDLSKDQYGYMVDQVDEFLQMKKVKVKKFAYGTGEEATLRVLKEFGALEKQLMSLTDLPLSISGVQGYSPVFRYTDVFPPVATTYPPVDGVTKEGKNCLILNEKSLKRVPKYLPPIEISVQLSISGKWPDELEAVRKTKAAFHIQIADCLRKQHLLQAQGHARYAEVFKEGFVFRLEVAHQKEIALLKRQVSENRVERYRANKESIELEERLFHLPKLNSALHGLHSQQPSFGPTCCLAKRWLSAHLLDDSHIPHIVVELLVASMFLSPDLYKSAQTPQVAFLRLLDFFTRDTWTTEPIIVNFNNEMTQEEITAVKSSFKAYTPIFISTPYDHNSSMWTRKAPNELIVNRIGSLAKESLKLVDALLDTASNLSFSSLFRAPTSEYDCLIRLKSSLNPRRSQFHDLPDSYPVVDLYPFKAHSRQKMPVIGFDPIQCYLRELRNDYDQFALFFHDTYGGSVIGVLLRPAVLEWMPFKASNMNCRRLNCDGKLALNVAAMIKDFSILGRGLVKSVDIQSDRLASF